MLLYEEPYAGKPHVRICEGLGLRGLSLLDCQRVEQSGKSEVNEGEKSEKETSVCVNFRHY